MMRFKHLVIGAALVAGPAGAQPRGAASLPEVSALEACQALSVPEQRLACLDRAASALLRGVSGGAILVLRRSEVREARRSLFGFALPRIALFGNPDDYDEKEEVSRIASTVTAVKSLGYGRWSIQIADGAVWQTTEPLDVNPRLNDAVEIRRGVIGSYFLKVGRSDTVRALRSK